MKRRQWLATLSAIAAAATGSLGWLWMRKHAGNADRHAIVQAVFSSPLPPLTAQHLQLIRQLRVSWFPIESGAPGIDPLQPLRGPHSSLENAQQILQIQNPTLATQLLAEVCLWIPEFVASATLPAGIYTLPADFSRDGQPRPFEFQPEHLPLLHAAQWREIGADNVSDVLANEESSQTLWPMPYIDGKRPYGDRSYYQIDMAELLGQPYAKDAHGRYILPAEKDETLKQLHLQTQEALQLLLMHGTPAPEQASKP